MGKKGKKRVFLEKKREKLENVCKLRHRDTTLLNGFYHSAARTEREAAPGKRGIEQDNTPDNELE